MDWAVYQNSLTTYFKLTLALDLRFAIRLSYCLLTQSNCVVAAFRFLENQQVIRFQHIQQPRMPVIDWRKTRVSAFEILPQCP